MKKVIVVLSAGVIFSACQKNEDITPVDDLTSRGKNPNTSDEVLLSVAQKKINTILFTDVQFNLVKSCSHLGQYSDGSNDIEMTDANKHSVKLSSFLRIAKKTGFLF